VVESRTPRTCPSAAPLTEVHGPADRVSSACRASKRLGIALGTC
jgi:hypothetical protein